MNRGQWAPVPVGIPAETANDAVVHVVKMYSQIVAAQDLKIGMLEQQLAAARAREPKRQPDEPDEEPLPPVRMKPECEGC